MENIFNRKEDDTHLYNIYTRLVSSYMFINKDARVVYNNTTYRISKQSRCVMMVKLYVSYVKQTHKTRYKVNKLRPRVVVITTLDGVPTMCVEKKLK